jgi:hypothetical protein
MGALQDAYDDYIEKLFGVFVNEVVAGQNIDEAAIRFKAGLEIADKVFAKAKEIMSHTPRF